MAFKLFDLFLKPKEKKRRELIKNKPKLLMHTSLIESGKMYSLKPVMDKAKNMSYVFATDSEKIANIYTLQPFFEFDFGKEEKGAIIIDKDHKLLEIDKNIGYTYFLDSTDFEPFVEENGNFHHEWYCKNEIIIKKSIEPKKVCFNDVLKSGIQVFWVDKIETLQSMDKEMARLGVSNGNQKLEYLMEQTNWKPDKVMYLNRFRNICPVIKENNTLIVDYSKQEVNTKKK